MSFQEPVRLLVTQCRLACVRLVHVGILSTSPVDLSVASIGRKSAAAAENQQNITYNLPMFWPERRDIG